MSSPPQAEEVLTRPIIYTGNSRLYGATAAYSLSQACRIPTTDSLPESKAAPEHSLLRRCSCEFLGTFLFVFIAACCPSGPWLPTAIAAIYIGLVYTAGLISGAHLNPAISLAAWASARMPFLHFISYVLLQTCGGLLGGLFFRLLFGKVAVAIPVAPVFPFHFGEAALMEVIYTTMLAFVVLNVTCSVNNNHNQFYGLAVGFVIVAGGYAALKVSGALFNPALSLGLAISSLRLGSFVSGLWYALVELCAGLVAAFLFRICRRNEYRLAYETVYEVEHGREHAREIAVMAPPSLPIQVFSEFLGTFWLVTTAGLNMVLHTGAMPWSLAGATISLIYALGGVSGGYFNPAATLAIMLSGRSKCALKQGVWFILAQLFSAIPAGLITIRTGLPNSIKVSIVHDGLFTSYSRYDWFQVGLVELIFTFLLSYVVLAVATSEMHQLSKSKPWPNFYYAVAIGFFLAGGCYAASNVSGGYLNPAIALGFAVEGEPSITSSVVLKNWPEFANDIIQFFDIVFKGIGYYLRCLYYWIPEFLGAALAAVIFRITHSLEYLNKGAFH
mmetsp:Transcript_36355/g.58230  ORF Transcript_36355/g.58230 Transcript_36355/m.58230 type:complete len:558 (+) Transcript_36355:91-1764(+)